MLDFRFYFAIFLRRLPYFSVLVALGIGAGLSIALLSPAVYDAEARLVVESEQISSDLADTTVTTETAEQLQIIQQRILTRDTLLDMANRLGVYRGAGAPDDPMSPDDIVSDMRSRININRTGRGGATFVRVSFSAPTGPMAANVTNEVVTLMLQENVELRTGVSADTLEFFEQQVAQLDQELSQINGEILAFQEANQNALPDSLAFRRSQQAAAQERLLEQERLGNQLRDRRDQLVLLFEQTGSVDGLRPQSALSSEEVRLRQLQDQYNASAAILSLNNPRIDILRAQIEALEEVIAEQKAAQAGLANPENGGRALTDLDILVADIDGQLAYIEDQKSRITNTLEELDASISATPGNAVVLNTFERRRENLRAQYNAAERNRAQAETGDVIEGLTKGQRLTVIEQAVAPNSPTSPNRPRIAVMGLAGGLAMGFGFILLLELLNTKIRRPVDIENGLEITPLVTLPYIRTRAQVWRRRLIILAALLVVIVGLPALLWYVDTHIRPLQPIFERILNRLGL